MKLVEKHEVYQGRRVKRGLFKAGCGKIINAGINGALNILRKEAFNLNLLSQGVEAFVVKPVFLTC